MADLTITEISPVKVIEQMAGLAGAAITLAAPAVYFVAASGKFGLADEDGAAPINEVEGIALGAVATNEPVTIVKKGWLDLGDALDGLDYGAPVYLSATAGKLAGADPANGVVVGEVIPSWGATTADKLLRVDL